MFLHRAFKDFCATKNSEFEYLHIQNFVKALKYWEILLLKYKNVVFNEEKSKWKVAALGFEPRTSDCTSGSIVFGNCLKLAFLAFELTLY